MATTLGQYRIVSISEGMATWAKANPEVFASMKAEVDECVEKCYQEAIKRAVEESMSKKKPPKKPPVKGGY